MTCSSGAIWNLPMYRKIATGPAIAHGADKRTHHATSMSRRPTYIGFRVMRKTPDTTRDDAFSGFIGFTVVFARRKAMAPARLNPAPAIAKRTTREIQAAAGTASATVADDISHIPAAETAATMGGGTLSASVDMWDVVRPNV